MSSIYMWDDVTASLIPADAEYVAYYSDGTYANEAAIKARCPKAKLLSIAVRSADHANVLDVETGDAQIADIFYWLHDKQTGGIAKCPVIYTSVSNVDRMMITMHANRFVQGHDFVIWSAHYTGTAHICGPDTCKATRTACDATQFTNRAMGQSLDETLIGPSFLNAPVPPVKPPVGPPTPSPVSVVRLTIDGVTIALKPGQTYPITVAAA